MSNVLVRHRSISELEFYRNACELRGTLTRFVMNEKNVPKRYKFVFAVPMVNLLLELFNNITMANTIYAISEHEAQLRRDYQTKAIANCEQVLQLLQYMTDTLPIDVNKLRIPIDLIRKEIALLKAWRKATKVPAKE